MITVDKDKISQHTIGIRLIRKVGKEKVVYNLEQQISVLSMTQALSLKSMFLKAVFQDGIGFLERGLIQLGDTIEVSLYREEDDDLKILKEFRIVDISSLKQRDNAKSTQFSIHAVSETSFRNKGTKISRSWSGQVSAIAFGILTNYLNVRARDIDIEPTYNKTNIIFNKTSPFSALSQLEERAISYNGSVKDNLYFCFETAFKFKFASARSLINDARYFVYQQYPSKKLTEDEFDYFRIQHFEQEKNGNRQKLVEDGVLENEVVLFDVLNRKITSSDFDFDEDKDDILLLGKYPHFDYETLGLEVDNYPRVNSSFDKKNNVSIFPSEESYERFEWRDKKHFSSKAQLELLRQNKVTVKILGNHEISAGDVLRLQVPAKYFTDNQEQKEDRRFTGDYLVAAVRHDIGVGSNFFTILDLYKDAMELETEDLE